MRGMSDLRALSVLLYLLFEPEELLCVEKVNQSDSESVAEHFYGYNTEV
jgi:hypothetical protein